jgi:hypothetical protein
MFQQPTLGIVLSIGKIPGMRGSNNVDDLFATAASV